MTEATTTTPAAAAFPEMHSLATLSTAHIRPETDRWMHASCDACMEGAPAGPLLFDPYGCPEQYGWLVIVPRLELGHMPSLQGIPADLAVLLRACRDSGIDYLLLDRDGPKSSFRLFDWSES